MITSQNKITALFKEDDNAKDRRKALLITMSLYALIVLLFVIFGFTTPLPLPSEEGQIALLGVELETMTSEEIVEQATEPPVEEEIVPETPVESPLDIQTATEPEAPEVEVNKEVPQPEKPVEKVEEPKPVVEPVKQPDPKPDKPVETNPNPFLMSKPNQSNNTEPKGDENGKTTGKENVNGLSYNGKADGSPSLGGGLANRKIESFPKIVDESQENATVVVEVMVDRDGKVISVRSGVKGTTTTNSALIKKAENAAKSTVFNSVDDGAETITGTLTYYYKLR